MTPAPVPAAGDGRLASLQRRIWIDLPAWLSRGRPVVRAVAVDGEHLRAWPPVAVAAPAVALVAGLLVGWRPWSDGETFTATLFGILLLLAVASVGAALGAWALLGYVVADLLLFERQPSYGTSFVERMLTERAPLFIGYLLLASALVMTPLLAGAVGRQAGVRFRRGADPRTSSMPLAAVAAVATAGALTWVWSHAVPTLIRPVYTWHDRQPPIDAIAPIQENATALVLLAALLAGGRAMAEVAARRQGLLAPPAPPVRAARPAGSGLPALALRVLVTTLLMSGLFGSWWEAGLFALTLTAALLVRRWLPGWLPWWVRLVNRVPVVVRVLAAVAASWLVAHLVIEPAWYGTQSFFPVLLSATVSVLVLAVLLPRPIERQADR